MKRYVALLGTILLSIALTTPIVVRGTLTPIDELWALIVCGYPSEMGLDPQYMRNVLVSHYQFSEVRYIYELSYPNEGKDMIRNAIRDIPSDGDDLVFIFFMSHGCQRDDVDPVDEADGIDEGFKLEEAWGMVGYHYEYYWDDEFKEDLAALNYGRLVLLLQGCKVENQTEGCYSGGFIRDLSAPNRIIITPCNETGLSWGYILYPGEPWSHVGYFSRLFIDALNPDESFDLADTNNDNYVSMFEAFSYAYKNDPARIDGRETPQLEDDGNGIADDKDGLLSMETCLVSGVNLKSPDINDDGMVDIDDIMIANLAFGSYPGHPRWDSRADISGPEGFPDHLVDIDDVIIIAISFGKYY